jgi:hypothetical protein
MTAGDEDRHELALEGGDKNLPSTDREGRIRERAYKLWEESGRPEGRDVELWERAEDLIAMEENPAPVCCLIRATRTPLSSVLKKPKFRTTTGKSWAVQLIKAIARRLPTSSIEAKHRKDGGGRRSAQRKRFADYAGRFALTRLIVVSIF